MDYNVLFPQPPIRQEKPANTIPAKMLKRVNAFKLPPMPEWYVLIPDKRPGETGGFPVRTKQTVEAYARDAILAFVLSAKNGPNV